MPPNPHHPFWVCHMECGAPCGGCSVVYIPRGIVGRCICLSKVHFAQVLEYTPFARDPDFGFHEIIVGPLNAGPFRETDLDDSFSPERLFYYGPECESVDQYVGMSVSPSVTSIGPLGGDRSGRFFLAQLHTWNCLLRAWMRAGSYVGNSVRTLGRR